MGETALQAKFRELEEAQHTLSREEFEKKITTELVPLWEREMRAHGALEPDWEPLHKVVPLKWCDGFGFMGYEGAIRVYKQGFTRRCLYVDPAGRTYERNKNSFVKIPARLAVESVFADIEKMGFTRSTPYNKKNAAKRRRRIEKATGMKIIDIGGPSS